MTKDSPNTHDSLVSDLVRETGCAVAFPYYTPAPEPRYPQQFDEAYAAVEYFVKEGKKHGLKTDKIAFAGDSAGGTCRVILHTWSALIPLPGNMAVAMSTLAAEKKLPATVSYQV